MKEFVNNQLGMFIHWGIYAVSEIQEQVIARFDIENKEYENTPLFKTITQYVPHYVYR